MVADTLPQRTSRHVVLDGTSYMVKPGTYTKSAAPMFGARFTTGDPDYNNLSMWQHWVQKCLVGGMDAEEYADDAMYDDGVGVNTWEHEKVTLARDLRRGGGSGWAAASGGIHGVNGHKFIVYNEKLYAFGLAAASETSYLYLYVPGTDSWSRVTDLDGRNICGRSIATFDGKLFIGGTDATTDLPKLVYSSGALTAWTTVTNPAGVVHPVYSMRAFQRKLYVAYGTQIWRMKEDQTWDGNTVFYKADQNSESNFIRAMEVHLGFLYMLSKNGHIHRTDGNATFDIWSWDGQTAGVAIRSFDGRLFVSTNEFEDPANENACFGVLYQMSGSAMTELKRWGVATMNCGVGSLMVYNRRLFYGASNLFGVRVGFGVAMYDPVEDAHSFFASNSDSTTYGAGSLPYNNLAVDDVIVFGNKMFASARGHGLFYTRFSYKDRTRNLADWDTTAAGVQPGPTNGGWFSTSTYDAGTPGLQKLWRKVTVDYELPHSSTSIVMEYSKNGGVSWTNIATMGTPTARQRRDIYLPEARSTSLKLRFTLRSTNSIYTPIFYGFSVSYLPIPEANWMWTFTIVLSALQENAFGLTEGRDTEALIAKLSDAFRSKAMLSFTDAEGGQWSASGVPGVIIYDFRLWLPDLTHPLEGELNLTLLEAIETT